MTRRLQECLLRVLASLLELSITQERGRNTLERITLRASEATRTTGKRAEMEDRSSDRMAGEGEEWASRSCSRGTATWDTDWTCSAVVSLEKVEWMVSIHPSRR